MTCKSKQPTKCKTNTGRKRSRGFCRMKRATRRITTTLGMGCHLQNFSMVSIYSLLYTQIMFVKFLKFVLEARGSSRYRLPCSMKFLWKFNFADCQFFVFREKKFSRSLGNLLGNEFGQRMKLVYSSKGCNIVLLYFTYLFCSCCESSILTQSSPKGVISYALWAGRNT